MADLTDRGLAARAFGARQVNEAGIALIKEYEGLRLNAYLCPGRVWTVGYGHTRTAHPGKVITIEDAERLLREDLADVGDAVMRAVMVPLGDNQYAALCCFVFNIGATRFRESTLLRLLNRGWYEQVPAQLTLWNKAGGEVLGGLSRRRAAEARLWNRRDETAKGDLS